MPQNLKGPLHAIAFLGLQKPSCQGAVACGRPVTCLGGGLPTTTVVLSTGSANVSGGRCLPNSIEPH